jgi:hypothetical protein
MWKTISTLAVVIELMTGATLSQADEVADLGTQAYVFGLPAVKMYLKRQEHLQLTPVNQFRHLRDIITPEMDIISPNVDVLYSLAWLDLRHGPIVLTLPDAKGRYFSFQTVDFYTDNGTYASHRTQAGKFKHLAYVGPNWTGKLPPGLQRLDCSTEAVVLIGRTLVAGPHDLAPARALQEEYQLAPLGPPKKKLPPIQYPTLDLTEPLNFFVILDEVLRRYPPAPYEASLVRKFKTIGLGAKEPFRVPALTPATRASLTRALEAGQQLVAAQTKQLQQPQAGWVFPPAHTGRFGTNHLLRAAASTVRLGINSPRECLYVSASVDQDNQPLDAAHRYVLRFAKDQLPPVYAFWSVTMYQWPDRAIVSNALGRVNLQSVDPNLRYGADGSLEIFLQTESPGPAAESNWLPTPPGKFCILLRLYEPHLSALKREWTPPVVKRLP